MWLSAALLLTMVLTLDSSWSLYIGPLWPTKYWKNTTACLQHKPQTGCHKTVRKLLNKCLLMVTFENDEIYLRLNCGPVFNLIRNEKSTIRTALNISEGTMWKLTRQVAPKPLQFITLLPTAQHWLINTTKRVTLNNGLDSWLFLKSLYWATIGLTD